MIVRFEVAGNRSFAIRKGVLYEEDRLDAVGLYGSPILYNKFKEYSNGGIL